jgi:ATP-binding cassette, subfamily B, bacterial
VFVPAVFTVLGIGNTFADDNNVEYGVVMLPALETVERAAGESGLLEQGTRPRPAAPNAPSVVLRGVSFAYPGSEDPILHEVDLEIPSGSSATLVGMNGAGKTTLVRLMCGLYRPASGSVLVDGVDLGELDLDAWHAHIGAMFQEFVRLPVSVSENVGAGAIEHAKDADAVRASLDEAGALRFSTALRDGLETKLATRYAEGSDVSGGQWQRIGLARALFALRAGARFLVLDEPTSNLDTSSEERLVRRLLDDTRGTCTAVLVTHRLALARRTDQILVVEGGRIVERGSHDDLVALDGRYARAFDLQASLYPLEETAHGA